MKSYSICHVCCGKWSLIFIHQVTYKLTLFLSFFLYIYSLDFFAYQSTPSLIFFFTLRSVALHRCTVTPALGPLSVGTWVASSLSLLQSVPQGPFTVFTYPSAASLELTETMNCPPSSSLSQQQHVCALPCTTHAHPHFFQCARSRRWPTSAAPGGLFQAWVPEPPLAPEFLI